MDRITKGMKKFNCDNEIVTVTCYGNVRKETRHDAIDFFLDCASMSDPNGSEYQRYYKILQGLYSNKHVISDED